ncbi:MAG: DUF4290 domain-containing protein [Chlorobi bacterium]|nr:DUF4290 domain-containing protein [Chlorobiota bacterium]
MDYNTSRKKLVLPEYGRNIQKMVNHLGTIEDKEKRTRMAHGIINIMAIMHRNTKDSVDLRRKLWDHLAIMSDFKLDIDAPFPPPDTFKLNEKPKKVPYNNGRIRFMHYGKVIENMIKKAAEYEDGEEKEALLLVIANHMKKLYINWNRELMSDETIFDDIYTISQGKITVDKSIKLISTKELMKSRKSKKPAKPIKGSKNKQSRRYSNHRSK